MPRQFVIQLENHPGELAFLARSMASRGISITHITCAGAGPLACAIVTTADDQETRDVLNGLGHDYLEGETIVVDVPEEPEGLAEVTERLAQAGVRILGTMCVGRREGITEMAFAVDDLAKAREACPRPSWRSSARPRCLLDDLAQRLADQLSLPGIEPLHDRPA